MSDVLRQAAMLCCRANRSVILEPATSEAGVCVHSRHVSEATVGRRYG